MKNTSRPSAVQKVNQYLVALLTILAAPAAFAASQTWSNEPTDVNWNTAANWIGNAVPGGINMTGNTVNNDTATFNTAIPESQIGGATSPVLIDDATAVGARSRQLGSIVFDTVDCGAYVFSSLSPEAVATAESPQTGILNVSHNGSIRMNSEVTSSQNFMVPVYIRLPSSTAGIYNFVNDAASPSATLYLASARNDSAGTRGTDFRLGGSNTGTNTIGALSAGTTTTGANGLTKQGAGTWILSGPNDFRSQTVIRIVEGTLVVKDAGVFGLANTATITNTGVLQIDGVTINQFSFNLHNGGTIRMNGSASVNGVAVGTASGTSATLQTTSVGDELAVGTFASGSSIISGGTADTVLNTDGPGNIVLNTPNTYAGRWAFHAKATQIGDPSALGTGANANVGPGATFDFTPLGATTYTPSVAGFGGSGVGTTVGTTAAAVMGDAGATLDLSSKDVNLTFTPASVSGDTTHPALYIAQGTLALGGNTFYINNASETALGVGTYRLIQQASGDITSSGGYAALISGSGVVGGSAAAIVVNGGNVDLVVTSYTPKNLSWTGGNPDNTWDLGTTANWLDGAIASVFNNSDNVTFNSTGSANPAVNLVGTLAPVAVTVDTSANDYTLAGSGQIAGAGGLTKISAGVLDLQTVNTYAGGTVISDGTLRVGVENSVPAVGSGNVAVHGPGVLDLNGFNNTVNALLGDGTVDNQSGGASILTIGNNDQSGTFSGLIKNSSGTLGVTKLGTGQMTLAGANTYTGPTVINAGTLEVQNANALGSGASPVTLNGGNLRMTTNLNVNSLTGAQASTVANSAGADTTIITHQGTGNYTGAISDGASGTVGIYIPSGSLRLNGVSTYSGGTVVASGATLAIGVINPGGSGVPGSAGITASNNATISLPTSVSTSTQVPNAITNVDANGTVYFPSSGQANSYNGLFIGGANSTNIFSGPMSIGGASSFAGFAGTAVISNNASVRFFAATTGGDAATFEVRGGIFTRDATTVRLGALTGSADGGIYGPSVSSPATYVIGAKDLTTTFPGIVSGFNHIIKTGAGGLTLNGIGHSTNQVTLPDSSVVDYTLSFDRVTYTGSTTVSNGTLKIVAPNNLNNSSNVTLAGGILDVTEMGYFTNQTTLDINSVEQPTNSVIVTNATLQRLADQSLNGFGSILGNVTTDPATTITVGLPVGTLNVSGSFGLNGAVNMDLDRSNSPTSDNITAGSFTGSGATLNVSNLGATLVTGDTFQLFNGPVSAFTTVNLPVANFDNSVTYTWTNRLASDGSIQVLSGANPVDPTPTEITSSVVGNTLQLSWPSSHTGWVLQSQTNALDVGLTGEWFDVAGSTTTNEMFFPINPDHPTVFYRLILSQP